MNNLKQENEFGVGGRNPFHQQLIQRSRGGYRRTVFPSLGVGDKDFHRRKCTRRKRICAAKEEVGWKGKQGEAGQWVGSLGSL